MNNPARITPSAISRPPLRLGLFGIGLDAYWPQFPDLKEQLEGNLAQVAQKLARIGIEITNLGLIDHPDAAYAAGREFRRQDVDLIFLHVTTYALSSTVLPAVLRAKVTVIVLNLVPVPAIDYAAFNALGEFLRCADIITLRTNLTPASRHRLNARAI